MNKKSILAAFLSLGLLPFLAGTSQAQELSARYTKSFDNGSLSLSFGTERRANRYRPTRGYGRRPLRSTNYYGNRGYRYGYGRVWIAGRYEVVHRKVWVPGYSERIWIEPIYEETCDAYGNASSILVRAGHYKTIRHPGRYEVRREKVWRPGYWSRR